MFLMLDEDFRINYRIIRVVGSLKDCALSRKIMFEK